MGKYDNVTAKELHEKKLEILNSLGKKGEGCLGVECENCPLSCYNNKYCGCEILEVEHFDEYVKIIMEYEPKVDWGKVEVDTKIMVRGGEDCGLLPRHFAGFENGEVYAWLNGATRFSANKNRVQWNYAKLYKE